MIYALVTVYNPSETVVNNIKAISKQVNRVVLCDNSCVKHEDMFSEIDNVDFFFFKENLGLSAAFNRILKKYKSFNCEDFIIFFDQDSQIADNHVNQLIEDYKMLENKGIKIGCLGPVYFNVNSGSLEIPRKKKHIENQIYCVSSIITSSMLCRYGKLEEIGFWNEDIFLDMADWDLCWRFQKYGLMCCLDVKIVLNHSLGEGEKKIGFLKLEISNPVRGYYQIREALYLMGKSYVPLKYRIRFIYMLTIRPVFYLIFFDKKNARIKYFFKGIKGFICRERGAYM